MLVTERRPRTASDLAQIRELEALWHASPDAVDEVHPRRRPAARVPNLYPLLRNILVGSWLAVMVSILFAPEANAQAQNPVWTDVVLAFFFLTLLAAALGGASSRRLGLAASAVAGGLGTVIGIACRATEHHLGAWWMYETGAFSFLTALSIVCLALAARSERG